MLIDVSLQITEGAVYRLGTPPVNIENRQCYHEDEGGDYTTTTLFMPLHTATHIDLVYSGNVIAVERFIGPGKMLDVSGVAGREIKKEDCPAGVAINAGEFVFFKTNWSRYLGSDQYYDHPDLSEELLTWLIEKKVNMVGIDALGLGRGKKHGVYDRLLVNRGIYVIENLINLDAVSGPVFTVYCFPLKISDTDAVPARVLVEM